MHGFIELDLGDAVIYVAEAHIISVTAEGHLLKIKTTGGTTYTMITECPAKEAWEALLE